MFARLTPFADARRNNRGGARPEKVMSPWRANVHTTPAHEPKLLRNKRFNKVFQLMRFARSSPTHIVKKHLFLQCISADAVRVILTSPEC